jgi:hypothetical protein
MHRVCTNLGLECRHICMIVRPIYFSCDRESSGTAFMCIYCGLLPTSLAHIGNLINYGQNAHFWTFSHGGKSKNDTKPVSVGCQESKNRKFFKNICFFYF